ncbi:MAG: DUF378 domain-containing protein, partial [Gammaproteobacteria bacterium]|nr:DUF378 domain-containing protein [Gammaproteobacteria bacterium]
MNHCLIGIFNFDIVSLLFGDKHYLARAIYTLLGIAGVWSGLYAFVSDQRPARSSNASFSLTIALASFSTAYHSKKFLKVSS